MEDQLHAAGKGIQKELQTRRGMVPGLEKPEAFRLVRE